jgi:ATP-dependent DNA ligase
MPSRLRPPCRWVLSRLAFQCVPHVRHTVRFGLHEIKHDGFRAIARKDGLRVKIYSRPGNELTHRFPLLVEALARLRARSCIMDGEAVACGEDGIASFDRIRYRHNDDGVFLYAFDLIELNGDDLRRWSRACRDRVMSSQLRAGHVTR